MVIKDGVVLYPDEMLAVMEIKPFATRAEVRNTGLTTPASR